MSLANRYAPLQELTGDDSTDIETHWKHSKELWIGTCEEVFGKKRLKYKEGISEGTIQKIEARKEKKKHSQFKSNKKCKCKGTERVCSSRQRSKGKR